MRATKVSNGWLPASVTFLLAIGICLAQPGAAAAQGTITGSVVDAQNGEPVASVQIFIADLDIGGLTQANGRYLLQNVPPGTYTVSAARIGYQIETAQITVGAAGETVVQNFEVAVQVLALDELIVTGTAGGTQRRAVGNVVERISLGSLLAERSGAINTFEDALRNRSPGVTFLAPPGVAGGGAPIRIRGVSSLALAGDPIIYVDGVRISSDRSRKTNRYSSVSRLNDIPVSDIESIEVIKGPAAATLYGTEASNGVVQIITKRGIQGTPVFSATTELGRRWLPFHMMPTLWVPNPDLCPAKPCNSIDELIGFNHYDAELARAAAGDPRVVGNPEIFQKALQQSYTLSVRGGTELMQYFASVNRNDQGGVVEWNWDVRNSVRASLTLTPREDLSFTLSGSFMDGENADANGFWAPNFSWGGAVASFLQPDNPLRGFSDPPEEFYLETQSRIMDRSRSIWTFEARHQATDWLTHRFVLGADRYSERDVRQRNKDAPGSAFTRTCGVIGCRDIAELIEPLTTVDLTGTVALQVTDQLGSETSYGLQYYHKSSTVTLASARGFAVGSLRTIGAGAVTTGGETFVENTTVGVYLQEQFSWEDRIFLTVAARADDNSAFGTDFEAIIYPKVSGTWVVHEEPFWNVDFVNQLRLRGAWGQAGQQPDAFAASRLYNPTTGPGQSPILVPQTFGNPDLGPEVGEELELGFDASFLDDRVGLNFTQYWRTTKDALITQPVAPSIGVPGIGSAYPARLVNIGEIRAWGSEALVTVSALTEDPLRWDFALSVSRQDNRIEDMGGAIEIKTGLVRAHREGFPLAFISKPKVVSADFVSGDRGPVTNIMCDGGRGKGGIEMGGPPVPCDEAPDVFWGTTQPTWIANLNSTITLFENWTLSATIAGEGGHMMSSEYLGARTLTRLASVLANLQDNAIAMGHVQTDRNALSFHRAGFLKLRELAVSYVLPESFVSRLGADRARLTVGGRNLWRMWNQELCPPTEPRTCAQDAEANRPQYDFQGEGGGNWPPLSQITVSMNVSF